MSNINHSDEAAPATEQPATPAAGADAGQDQTTSVSSIPLPPRSPAVRWPATPEQLRRETLRLDRVLTVVGVVIAFLLASFAIRNTDYWMHAATGRLLAHGNYQFGKDPFAYTTDGVYWVNHSWLFDLGLYAVTSLLGGPETAMAGAIAVIGKALLTVLVFWLMMAIRRPGQSVWLPCLMAVLAVLAMSPRLLLQPMLLSVLFMILTLFILVRPRHMEVTEAVGPRKNPLNVYWLLPPLFVLWVNMDSWFFLGPLVVLLYLLGHIVQAQIAPIRTGSDAPEPDTTRRLTLVLVAGIAACLVNPHHYHALTLPPQLFVSAPRELFRSDPWLMQWFTTPVDEFRARMTWAGGAYFVLLALGFGSFALCLPSGWRWWRLFIWLPFAVLAMYQLRTVPFFAVLSAPITALNFQDFAAARAEKASTTAPTRPLWSLAGRLVSILAGLVLIAAAWPGWLHGMPGDGLLSHRVTWSVVVDPSLKRVCEQLKTWRTEGKLKESDHGFNYLPEIVNYSAWFCTDEHGQPMEKGFFDQRLQLYSEKVIKDYADIRRSLRISPSRTTFGEAAIGDWRTLLPEYRINHVILSTPTSEVLEAGQRLVKDWHEWRLVYLDGRSTVFFWNQADSSPREAANRIPRLDFHERAFGSNPEKAPAAATRDPEPLSIWARFRDGPPVRPLDADESLRYYDYFNQIAEVWPIPAMMGSELGAWSGAVASLPSAPSAATVLFPATFRLNPLPARAILGYQPNMSFRLGFDNGPAAAAVLAVRAARRAVAESPDNASSYYNLGQAYLLLWARHEDRWQPSMRPEQDLLTRQKLRQVQIATAFEQCLKLNPSDALAHLSLSTFYQELGYLDLADDHLGEAVKLMLKQGASSASDEVRERFDKEVENFQKRHKELDTLRIRRRDEFELSADSMPTPLAKAQLALSKGLPQQALEILSNSEAGPEAMLFNLNLWLNTGKADEVRRELNSNDDLLRALGPYRDRYQALVAAATGNYDEANQSLDTLIRQTESSAVQNMLNIVKAGTFQGVLIPGSLRGLNIFPELVRQLADMRVLRGLLLLEKGDNEGAAGCFREALDGADSDQLDFNGRVFAERYLKLLPKVGAASGKQR
jgi:tetratricopeptide (TPR) repeat protein